MNRKFVVFILILAEVLLACSAFPRQQISTATPAIENTVTASGVVLANPSCAFTIDQSKLVEMFDAANTYRAQLGMAAYTINLQLVLAAQSHAGDMACNQLTSDTGSNGSNVAARVTASGYTASYSGENVYVSNPPASAQGVINVWKTQNNNLVSDTFTEIGIGYASFNGTGYYVLVLATP